MKAKGIFCVALLGGFLLAAGTELREIAGAKAWRNTGNAKQEQTFAPVQGENSIRFGSKTLLLEPNGTIRCTTPDAGLLFSGNVYFCLNDNGKIHWNWQSKNFDKTRSTFRHDGKKYIWELWYGSDQVKPFLGVDQILEIEPDGQLAISYRFNMPPDRDGRKFQPWTWTFSLPEPGWFGKTVSFGGRLKNLDSGFTKYSGRPDPAELQWDFGVNDPARKFSLLIRKNEAAFIAIQYRKVMKDYMISFNAPFNPKNFTRFRLDLRRGLASQGRDIRGGVDFKAQENLTLPDNRRKNLLVNPSFERGMDGWRVLLNRGNGTADARPFVLDNKIFFEGKHALRFEVWKGKGWRGHHLNIGPTDIAADPGFYTLSFYARKEPGKNTTLCFWVPKFRTGSYFEAINNDSACWKFPLTDQWKRYQVSFELKKDEPMISFAFYGEEPSGKGYVWLDAFQLEKGKQATAYQAPPAEGLLITSAPDNFISSKDRIDGKLRITTARPEMSGEVRVTVKNFFGEKLLDVRKRFKTGQDRTAEVALPLDGPADLGVFVLKAEYTLDDGSSAYDFRRYARVQFQQGPRPNKTVFGVDYSDLSSRYDFIPQLERWHKLGVGAKHHVGNLNKKIWALYEKYGVKPYIGTMLQYQRGGSSGPHISHFFILDSEVHHWSVDNVNDPRILVRDFHLDSDGTITPAYLAKLRQAAKTMAAKYPHVRLWGLGGELTCKMPNDWWGKGSTDRDVVRKLARLLKAFAEGVREGNPGAKIFQDDPANMDPRGGIAETGHLLEECNKIGLRFDVIAIHPYRFSPESPDLDADAQRFLDMLEKHGYGNTPVLWPEGMLWGPFDIPQWGTRPQLWGGPSAWYGRLLSYDMGWTEKKTAAWFARAWLVNLKYSDRVLGSTSGQTGNNCYMDTMLTPYAAQLIPNTLCAVLGDAKFRKDIRFAPYIRAYIFEDAQNRPVAAVWCHKEEIDSGSMDAPVAAADFGNSLESVIDLMNTRRAFTPGRMKFPVGPFPLFFRGKPETLKQIIAAFEKAEIVSGKAVSPLSVQVNPADANTARITFRNFISRDFVGRFNSEPVRIPASGTVSRAIRLNPPLKYDAVTPVKVPVKLQSDRGSSHESVFSFEAFAAKRVPDDATIDSLDWKSLPAVPIKRRITGKGASSGAFRLGWNKLGLFLEVKVRDAKFIHVEYPKPARRWENDCVQVYFDTFANARQRSVAGYDEDDYDYAIFPDSKGTSAQVFRYRTVEPQLGLATQAPRDYTFAPDMPCRFSNAGGVLTYRVFFPAKYLLPMKLQAGWAFGFSLTVQDSVQPGKTVDALTLATDGKGNFNRPHVWPVAVLTE